jgi:hypothetical protein
VYFYVFNFLGLFALGDFTLLFWVAFTQIGMLYFHGFCLATIAWDHLGFEQRQPEDNAAFVLSYSVCAFCFHPCRLSLNGIK